MPSPYCVRHPPKALCRGRTGWRLGECHFASGSHSSCRPARSPNWKRVLNFGEIPMTETNWKVSLIGIAVLLVASVSTFVGQNRETEIISSAGPQAPEESKATLGPGNQPETDRPTLQLRNPRYQLRRGDSFELNFPYAPAFNQNLTVHPDGYITLRGVGDLRVEGRTIPELTQALRTEYSKIFQEPTITVDLKDFEKPYFIASGEVERPGKYDLRGDTTVAQAVAIAVG
ncbi:MAG: hypothetical protein DMG05_19915 [Acidobacteria bacterium]|nr:MAG: hypothetical protein DMG05_19915 [Acidobacteriota bacterium]